MTTMMTTAAEAMAGRFTLPFARGTSTLSIPLIEGGNATQAQVDNYDFSDYLARFVPQSPPHQSLLPRPRYILVAERDITVMTQVTVDYRVQNGTATSLKQSRSVSIPPGTYAGASFVLDVNGEDDPDIRLQTVHMSPAASDGEAAHWWSLRALLGNLAKLLWVIGWEKDNIRRHLALTQVQQQISAATGFSLDLLGHDLGIPRFPPQPYSFDQATIALYHLDDRPATTKDSQPTEVAQVEDMTVYYIPAGQASHPGTNTGLLAKSGAAGRFGSAFAFTGSNAEIAIADHPEFNPGGDFTVECFVMPARMLPDKAALIDRQEIIAKHPNPVATTTQAGWALSLGAFQRGIPFNIRFLLCDGVHPPVLLFADTRLSTDRFTHVAGVIDRTAHEARLSIDGKVVSAQAIAGLGAIANTEPVRIGRSPTAAYQGVIDEVRFSRVARSTFHPVLGEDDEAYRRRLKLFGRWTLPTLSNLQDMINTTVGEIGGDPQPLILQDKNAAIIGGMLAITVQPDALAAGECIDAQGNNNVREADVNGTAAEETNFNPAYLVTHNDPRATYTPPPARSLQRDELPPDPHKMQLAARRRLDQLLNLLGTSGSGGTLTVESAFDPQAGDLRAVGRGLLLTHSVVGLEKLAAFASKAGFSFVCNRRDLGQVYASVEPGEYIEILVDNATIPDVNGFSFVIGNALNLKVNPKLPSDAIYRWVMIPCGPGRANFSTRTDRSTVTLTAPGPQSVNPPPANPGILHVKVEISLRQSRAVGTSEFRLGPDQLTDGAVIADDGAQDVEPSIAGEPDDFFHPAYLVTHADTRATYGTDINNRRMQPAVAQRLDQLLTLITANSTTTPVAPLAVVQAFVPGATDLHGVGRALVLQHPTLSAGTLGVLAHAAGFTYVSVNLKNNQVLVLQRPGELVRVDGPQQVEEHTTQALSIHPRAAPQGIAIGDDVVYIAGSGTDIVSEIDPASGLVKRTIKVGWGPVALARSPDGKRLYTADSQGNTITAVDITKPATGSEGDIPTIGTIAGTRQVQPGPVAVAHHPANQRLYVACQGGNALQEINTATLTPFSPLSLPGGSNPTGMALTPDGKALWVALNGINQINIIDSSVSPIAVGTSTILLTKPAFKIAISPDGRAYVIQPGRDITQPQNDSSITVLDVAKRTIINTLTIGQIGIIRPVAVAATADAVYITDTVNERIYIFKPDDLAKLTDAQLQQLGSSIGSVRVQQEPLDMAVADQGQRVYVVNRGGDAVSVIDPQEQGVANTWQLGSGLGESLIWVLRPGVKEGAHLNTTTAPQVKLSGDHAGPVLVRAIYALRNNTAPYAFDIRLKPALESTDVTIRKGQYDLITNILNAFHPIGVEVNTLAIRRHVVEIRNQPFNAFPDYTFPVFRVRGPLPRRSRKG